MRDRLVENGFDDDYNCIVVHLGGQPARATRRLIKPDARRTRPPGRGVRRR